MQPLRVSILCAALTLASSLHVRSQTYQKEANVSSDSEALATEQKKESFKATISPDRSLSKSAKEAQVQAVKANNSEASSLTTAASLSEKLALNNIKGNLTSNAFSAYAATSASALAQKMFRGCFVSPNNTCLKAFVAVGAQVCYEQKLDTPAHTLETSLFLKKVSFPQLYWSSFVIYGMDCASLGYTFNKKPHPCYPVHMWTVFQSQEAQVKYRAKRQEDYDFLNPDKPLNVTEWMLSGNCVSTETLEDALTMTPQKLVTTGVEAAFKLWTAESKDFE